MAGLQFLLHPQAQDVKPFSTDYVFPSQSTRCAKHTVKLSPKNNVPYFTSGGTIRFELPASGYLNPCETVLAFNLNVVLQMAAATVPTHICMQNNIQSVFRRVRIMYGSLVLEDIQDYSTLVRILTDITSPPAVHRTNHGMITGIGKFESRLNYHAPTSQLVSGTTTSYLSGVKRYAVQLYNGLFMQRKLIPMKWMSSQIAIELEIAPAVEACELLTSGTTQPVQAMIQISQVELVAQLLEFDTKFDEAVFEALKVGLPIQFQSWHLTVQNLNGISNNLQIQERARSVRAAFAVITDESLKSSFTRDTHTFFAAGGALTTTGALTETLGTFNQVWSMPLTPTTVESYQWRIGGRYFPSQPVQVTGSGITPPYDVSSAYPSPGPEAWFELQKVMNNLDFKQTMLALEPLPATVTGAATNVTGTFDYFRNYTMFSPNCAVYHATYEQNDASISGTDLDYSNKFIIAGDFCTDRGDVVSGLNAEENSDMQLTIRFLGTAPSNKVCRICIWYDALIIVFKDNGLSLVT